MAVVEPSTRGVGPVVDAPARPQVESIGSWLIDRDAWNEATADPFVPKQPPPPPPQVVQPPPPPRPVAPPFPFKYFGRVTAPDGTKSIYLTQGDRLIPIRANETMEGGYRIESIGETQIVVVYVPMGEKTVIALPPVPGMP